MVQIAFFLRFKQQLQRIRPELVPRLENMTIRSIEEVGGKLTGERSLIRAVFNEDSLGFWLDILLLVETITQTLEKAAVDLHGYSFLIGKALPESPHHLCRLLAGREGGVFLDKAAAEALQPYVTVEEKGSWTETISKHNAGVFFRLNGIKIFVPVTRLEFPLKKTNDGLADLGQRPAVLIAGQSFEGKRDKLYSRIAGIANPADNGDFSPLFVRFGNGGLNSLTDSWAGWMRSPESGEELYTAWEFLFRQRLMDKPSSFAIRTARHFFSLLLGSYQSLAQAQGKTPIIILENIQNVEQATAGIVIESLRGWENFLLLGTCTGEMADADMEKWNPLFPQLTRIGAEEISDQQLQNLPPDLWEIGYACSLLGRYFPPDLLPRLLEEAGKNSRMISHALSLLYTLRVLDTQMDPRPWHKDFQYRAEAALGERKDRVRAVVRSLLLAWVAGRKINPCLRLLEILKELDGAEDIDDNLILRSIHCELAGADESAFEHIRYNNTLENIAGPVRAPILHSILETMLALHSGNIQNINVAFTSPSPDCSAFPLLKAQTLLNQSLHYMGQRDIDSAIEAVKEASMLCQGNGGIHLAQIFRLFALASLLRGRIGETIDYLGFALENAAKSGIFHDIGISAYYAASVQLLYGNLSRARDLAEKACRHFLKAGNPEWADRSRFLLGKVAFETGSYQQSVDIFEDIRHAPEGASSPEKNDLLEAWAYRAKVCLQPFPGSGPQGSGHDANLFEIETLCLAGDYSRAVELSGIAPPWGDDFFCIERPDWRSGFAQCELLCFSWDDLRSRMFNAYHSIAQAGLSRANGEEALRTMQRVLRSGQFPEIDPYDIFYHYAWYRVLQQTDSSQVDITTAVSVAFKRLQSRAARIDDTETRRQYLTQPLWNKALEQAARELKLV